MTNPTPHDTARADSPRGPEAPEITLSREQLRVGTEWVVAGHVRLRRRIVSETRTIEVTLRREELVVETDAAVSPEGAIAAPSLDGEPTEAPVLGQAPMVFVLRAEIPEVVTHTQAYEKVTAHVGIAQTTQHLTEILSTEMADTVVDPVDFGA